MRRVVITGVGHISTLGNNKQDFINALLKQENFVKRMDSWTHIQGLNSYLAAPIEPLILDKSKYNRKSMRSMGSVSLYATKATELALEQANLLDSALIKSGKCGIAYGSCSGSTQPILALAKIYTEHTTADIDSNSYIKSMPQTTAVNISLFFGITGRIIPTPSACTSSSQAIGFAYENIKYGLQDIMIAGGAEELCPSQTAVFDTLFATSTKNDSPKFTPRPFDVNRDGLVIGEGAATLILEEYEHAKNRNANILAEIVGFATNNDACHVTQPNYNTMQTCITNALYSANLEAKNIDFISAHGTGTPKGDIAESIATFNAIGANTPISSLKSYTGHTLGACGGLELISCIYMMQLGRFAPTLNLEQADEQCAKLDYIMHDFRDIDANYIMSNNFAFGGINTSLIIKKI